MDDDEGLNNDLWSGSRISMVRDPMGNVIIDAADAVMNAGELARVVMSLWIGAHSIVNLRPKSDHPEPPESDIKEGGYA